ncbi:MAG TPA: hypothetical protein PLD47_10705 [Aggregatilineales bacterium]|nr:hypothetical protein [Anaerolineales bacterium]HRE48184.1 hypothetical protein [Aggregatilineales bacterium]
MPIFVLFVFASVIFGAGAMLSPALPTYGPRVGLAGALTLAFITTGGIFLAALFGWDTLLIDYMWFAAIVGIFFTGTLSAGMFRTEAEGGTRTYSGWAGPRELAFFALVAFLFTLPALILPVPLDTDAQGFGVLSLTLRDSGSLTTLAPFHPEISYLYSPGFPAIIAYLGARLNAGIHTIQFAVGAVLAILFVWIAYDFGNELDPGESRRMGIVFGIAALLSGGLFSAYLDSHFTALLGLVFSLAFLTFALRFHREGRRADFFAAVLCLGAVPLSQPDMTIILMFGYVPWLIGLWFTKPRPIFREFFPRWLGLAAGIPGLAFIGLLPWLAQLAPLLTSDIASPFHTDLAHLLVLTVYQGVVIVPFALGGMWIALRRRNTVDNLMLVWILLILDNSSIGITRAILGWLPIFKYDYPFSVAWHGAIIPYLYFAAIALLWITDRLGVERTTAWVRRFSLPLIGGIMLIGILVGANAQALTTWSKSTAFQMFGAFASYADVRAATWLRENTPRDTLILNHPGPHEGDWIPVITARQTVYFRPQPFFRGTEIVEARQAALKAFWRDPAAPENAALLHQYGVNYVIVPQVFGNPVALREMYRWRLPLPEAAAYGVPTDDLPYLKLVFESDGARVYEVR